MIMSKLVAVVGVALWFGAAHGEWAYNRYGEDWSYEVQAGSNVTGALTAAGYTDTANMFVSQATGPVSDIYVSVATNGGPNLLEVSLLTDAGTMPGEVLQSWSLEDQATPFDGAWHPPIHLAVDGPELQAGSAYWILCHAGDPEAFLVWHFTNPWIFETVGQRFSPTGPWTILEPGFTSAYAIAVVPEPGTVGLLVLAIMTCLRRR